jgi:predicted membrane-bound mannosyltransferase
VIGGKTSDRVWLVALGLAVLLGVVVRTVALERWPGINGDEAWYGAILQDFLSGRPTLLRTPPGNPLNPVHSLPLGLLLRVIGPTPAALRLPEVFWGILTVLLSVPLLTKPLGRRAARLAAVLLALSPAAAAYSRFG